MGVKGGPRIGCKGGSKIGVKGGTRIGGMGMFTRLARIICHMTRYIFAKNRSFLPKIQLFKVLNKSFLLTILVA